MEKILSVLKELAEHYDFENREEVIIGDIFITNIPDNDIQQELLRDTVEPKRALSIAFNMEMGHQKQQRMSSNNNNNNNNNVNSDAINAIQQLSKIRGANARMNQSSRYTFNRGATGLCRGCGQNWTSTHCQVCPVLSKKCNHCGLLTIGNTDCHLLSDSGSGCSIKNMSLAKQIMFNCIQANWSEKKPLELKSFSNNIVETLGTLKTPVSCNDWKFLKQN